MCGAVLGGEVVLRVMGVQLRCTDLQVYGPWVCAGGCVQAVLCVRVLAVHGVGCVCVTVSVYVHPVQCVLMCAHGCAYACDTASVNWHTDMSVDMPCSVCVPMFA